MRSSSRLWAGDKEGRNIHCLHEIHQRWRWERGERALLHLLGCFDLQVCFQTWLLISDEGQFLTLCERWSGLSENTKLYIDRRHALIIVLRSEMSSWYPR